MFRFPSNGRLRWPVSCLRDTRAARHVSSFVSAPTALGQRLREEGSWTLLASVAGRNSTHVCEEAVRETVFPTPTKRLFDAASRRRVSVHEVVRRARKRRRADLPTAEVMLRILWTRASVFFRNARRVLKGTESVLDAILGDWNQGQESFGDKRIPATKQLMAYRVRIDAVSCLLQRNARRHSRSLRRRPPLAQSQCLLYCCAARASCAGASLRWLGVCVILAQGTML